MNQHGRLSSQLSWFSFHQLYFDFWALHIKEINTGKSLIYFGVREVEMSWSLRELNKRHRLSSLRSMRTCACTYHTFAPTQNCIYTFGDYLEFLIIHSQSKIPRTQCNLNNTGNILLNFLNSLSHYIWKNPSKMINGNIQTWEMPRNCVCFPF